MRKLVKFLTSSGWLFGWLDTETNEITLPSGYTMPVDDDGNVVYMGETCKVLDV